MSHLGLTFYSISQTRSKQAETNTSRRDSNLRPVAPVENINTSRRHLRQETTMHHIFQLYASQSPRRPSRPIQSTATPPVPGICSSGHPPVVDDRHLRSNSITASSPAVQVISRRPPCPILPPPTYPTADGKHRLPANWKSKASPSSPTRPASNQSRTNRLYPPVMSASFPPACLSFTVLQRPSMQRPAGYHESGSPPLNHSPSPTRQPISWPPV